MKADDIKTVCVVGAGNMGHQISVQSALSGYRTWCVDIDEGQLEKARQFVKKYLPERVSKGRITQELADQAENNLSFTTSLEEAAGKTDFVIEAAVEKIKVKRDLFSQLDRIAPAHAILSTNSSYIVSSKVADATGRMDKICNMHFFNPALVMKCVEVVKGPHTSEETAEVTMELARGMNKEPVLLHKEIYGFLVNRILQSIHQEAQFLYDTGVASMQDIDSAVENALGHPMGPFRLMDLTGIDLAYHVRMERYQETMDPADKPNPCVVEKYVKGEWGKKVGKGFYDYEKN